MVMQKLDDEMNKGLSKETHDQAVVKCFATYVQDLPDGSGKRTCISFIIDKKTIYRNESELLESSKTEKIATNPIDRLF